MKEHWKSPNSMSCWEWRKKDLFQHCVCTFFLSFPKKVLDVHKILNDFDYMISLSSEPCLYFRANRTQASGILYFAICKKEREAQGGALICLRGNSGSCRAGKHFLSPSPASCASNIPSPFTNCHIQLILVIHIRSGCFKTGQWILHTNLGLTFA